MILVLWEVKFNVIVLCTVLSILLETCILLEKLREMSKLYKYD